MHRLFCFIMLVLAGCSDKGSTNNVVSVDYLLSEPEKYFSKEVAVRGYLAAHTAGGIFLYPSKEYSDIDGRFLWGSALYMADKPPSKYKPCLGNYVVVYGKLGTLSGNIVMKKPRLTETLEHNAKICH
ncbi:hypothetical protein [Microbulbifer sp. TYP-18]|uniref:hypothetical protein n=1 Tax=Microbulbifer sp. TYP-18 TaxID=3230024 RepID=UPI0034C61A95